MSTIRTYRAATVTAALALVRAELGGEALILGQREIRKRPFPWRQVVVETELTAAVASTRNSSTSTPTAPAAQSSAVALNSSTSTQVSDSSAIVTRLVACGVDRETATNIVAEASLSTVESERLPTTSACAAIVRQSIACSGPIRVTAGQRRIVTLVGTTGVGKTTTIAKLAAHLHLRKQAQVGLITIDTYRVAAVEQLRTYANLIGIPLQVVTTPQQLQSALGEWQDLDLVLIDTAGCSMVDRQKLNELQSFLQVAQADEIHLVASLTSDRSNLSRTANSFRQIGATSLLLTKLDEAIGPGVIVSAARTTQLPISYVATGQDVPDDIEIATPDQIARRILLSGATPHEADECPSMTGPSKQRTEAGNRPTLVCLADQTPDSP